MLILIAGITGNMGQALAHAALARGHRVRGLGRTASKLPAATAARLESFVTSTHYYDIPALERAVAGADAVICAYLGLPTLLLEGQLLLLRAAERAGINKFVACTWNYDWRTLAPGAMPVYDPIAAFAHHASHSSPIRPIHVLTGALMEVFFSRPGAGDFSPAGNNGAWDPAAHSITTYGSGDERWHMTSYADAAECTLELLQRPDAHAGGVFSVASTVLSLRDLAATYARVRGVNVPFESKGSLVQMRADADAYRATLPPAEHLRSTGFFFHLHTLEGGWALGELENARLPGAKMRSLEEWLVANPDV